MAAGGAGGAGEGGASPLVQVTLPLLRRSVLSSGSESPARGFGSGCYLGAARLSGTRPCAGTRFPSAVGGRRTSVQGVYPPTGCFVAVNKMKAFTDLLTWLMVDCGKKTLAAS